MNYLLSLGRAVIIPTKRVVIIKYCSFPILISERNTESKNKYYYIEWHKQHGTYTYYSHKCQYNIISGYIRDKTRYLAM